MKYDRNKKVVFTSITGEYDTLIQPPIIDDSFDYICFVKKGQRHSEKEGVWRIEEIPFECENDRQLSRYPKLLPHIVLPQYDYSLWIDGNVSINDAQLYEIINQKIEEGVLYSGVNHWERDCAYDEAAEIAFWAKDKFWSLFKAIMFLKKEHFPRHYGLYENNVIFRKHNDTTIVEFDKLWWHYAKRDQLCHPYCLKKFGIGFDYLVPKNYCTRNHPYFFYVDHKVAYTRRQGMEKQVYDFKRKSKAKILKYLSRI